MILDEILKKLKENNDYRAYTIDEKSYTYKEFYKYVCNIYNFLLMKDIGKKPIIVYGHKDIYMKASFLACSFAGIPYVPIDENMTKNRIDSIIEQVDPALIIGNLENDKINNISQKNIEKIMDKDNFKEIDKIYLSKEDIYYIIFTSGSTGIPKGVEITYKNVDSCIKWLKKITKIERGVILNQASFSFDLSVADLYLSLITQSEHFILEKHVQSNFKLLFHNLKKSNANIAIMTPSFVELLLLDKSFNKELLPNLKTILFCGETLLSTTIKKLYSRFEKIEIINCYGPTECTFAVTNISITLELANQEDIPVGKEKDNVKIYIVDEKCNKVEEGNIGEILIVGESVAKGYVEEDKNKLKGFIKYEDQNAYLTGDLGYIKDGILYYYSRKDKQIKYKGYRIEINDIQNNIYSLEYIDKVVVSTKIDKNNKVNKLIAFIKLKENVNKNSLEIRKELLDKIPEYMCPIIKIVNSFPLNQNGKCDEKKLLEEY